MNALAQIAGGWGIGHIAIAIVIAIVVIGIVIIVMREAHIPIPTWVWQIVGLVVLACVAIIAIKFVLSL